MVSSLCTAIALLLTVAVLVFHVYATAKWHVDMQAIDKKLSAIQWPAKSE